MGSLTDIITPGALLKWGGLFFAFLAFFLGPWKRFRARSQGVAPAVTSVVVDREKTSFLGRIGNALAMHTLISVVIGVIGFPLLISIVCWFCALVLWASGGSATLPGSGPPGRQTTWEWLKGEMQEVFRPAVTVVTEKKDGASRAVEEARKVALDSERKIEAFKRKADEEFAEKKRELERAAERVKEIERAAKEKVDAVEKAAAARVQEAKDLADKASSLTKAAGMLSSLPSISLPGFGAKSPEQVALDRERLEHQQAESEWRSYRASQPLSRMTLQEFKAARKAAMPPEMWEEERLRKAKWRAWNAGYDFR